MAWPPIGFIAAHCRGLPARSSTARHVAWRTTWAGDVASGPHEARLARATGAWEAAGSSGASLNSADGAVTLPVEATRGAHLHASHCRAGGAARTPFHRVVGDFPRQAL